MNKKFGTAVFMMVACAFGPMTAVAQEASGNIDITGNDETATHACAPGSTVEITGNANTVTLTGECKSVTVNGTDNKVKVEATGAISVTGNSNSVTWKRGLGKSKPKISRTGTDNKVTQEK
ncbi:DUF3060 domain-containing protein [Corallococcus sp. CA049B]|uniref:DUF3060 domain-containing protein n=1 Tax=Corallococcus sp. CA049B TaxID=2316730 RepID=UPI000EA1BA62|nr:DUF3060 domain-containing protein [Corallococcus sp. CA049B]RKG91553.1 DUF3060 domain-containing protein [Corallococcus sp. CA049B]